MTTLTYNGSLTIVTCWCGIRHAIPSELRHAQQNDPRQEAYCPVGHRYVTAKAEVTRLREEIERKDRQIASERRRGDRWLSEAEAQRRSAIAYKGHVTRMRNRVANGVCPVRGCKRSGFDRVRSHIATQHPDWAAEHPEVMAGAVPTPVEEP